MLITKNSYRSIVWRAALLLIFFAGACKTADKEADTDTSAIYFDYRIIAEEGMDNLTVLLHFRQESSGGRAFTLPGSFSVKLDGEEIAADSSDFAGTYYEMHKPIESFTGRHIIQLTGNDDEYEDEFYFDPVIVETEIPETVKRQDLVLNLLGRQDGELVRVVITDTSFGDGINKVDTLRRGQLLIPAADLQNIASGPVQLELTSESEWELPSAPDRGKLTITYTLRREFILQDE